MNPKIEKFLRIPLYQRILVLVLIVAAICAGFAFVIYMPKQEVLAELRQRNEQISIKLQEDRRIASNLPRFKAEYEKMEEQLSAALTELPNESEIPALLASIAGLAKDNGLEVVRFKPGAEVPKGFYAEVPVELKLNGSFHQAALFFEAVSDLSRIVNIANVQLSPKTAQGVTTLSIDCLAVTFRFLEEGKEQ